MAATACVSSITLVVKATLWRRWCSVSHSLISFISDTFEPSTFLDYALLLFFEIRELLQLLAPELIFSFIQLVLFILGICDLLPNGDLHDAQLFFLFFNEGPQLRLLALDGVGPGLFLPESVRAELVDQFALLLDLFFLPQEPSVIVFFLH